MKLMFTVFNILSIIWSDIFFSRNYACQKCGVSLTLNDALEEMTGFHKLDIFRKKKHLYRLKYRRVWMKVTLNASSLRDPIEKLLQFGCSFWVVASTIANTEIALPGTLCQRINSRLVIRLSAFIIIIFFWYLLHEKQVIHT